uniref:Uncharacterized protein n=1 Tax=Pleurostomum flabellatum TaxID=405751 RepID=A0A7T0Q4W9_9EUKA|nr:hypothetical protein J6731_mgp12 [Pleurostomum flabellatum]QPL15591.1 hypothetical protein [Pleurostomum flabellatum]
MNNIFDLVVNYLSNSNINNYIYSYVYVCFNMFPRSMPLASDYIYFYMDTLLSFFYSFIFFFLKPIFYFLSFVKEIHFGYYKLYKTGFLPTLNLFVQLLMQPFPYGDNLYDKLYKFFKFDIDFLQCYKFGYIKRISSLGLKLHLILACPFFYGVPIGSFPMGLHPERAWYRPFNPYRIGPDINWFDMKCMMDEAKKERLIMRSDISYTSMVQELREKPYMRHFRYWGINKLPILRSGSFFVVFPDLEHRYDTYVPYEVARQYRENYTEMTTNRFWFWSRIRNHVRNNFYMENIGDVWWLATKIYIKVFFYVYLPYFFLKKILSNLRSKIISYRESWMPYRSNLRKDSDKMLNDWFRLQRDRSNIYFIDIVYFLAPILRNLVSFINKYYSFRILFRIFYVFFLVPPYLYMLIPNSFDFIFLLIFLYQIIKCFYLYRSFYFDAQNKGYVIYRISYGRKIFIHLGIFLYTIFFYYFYLQYIPMDWRAIILPYHMIITYPIWVFCIDHFYIKYINGIRLHEGYDRLFEGESMDYDDFKKKKFLGREVNPKKKKNIGQLLKLVCFFWSIGITLGNVILYWVFDLIAFIRNLYSRKKVYSLRDIDKKKRQEKLSYLDNNRKKKQIEISKYKHKYKNRNI